MLILVICCLLTLGYAALMVAYRIGWARQKEFMVPTDFTPATFISVIIPARNEAANIGSCVDAILAQKYPKDLFEVIVVNDHSEDDTDAIVNSYGVANVLCINLADHLLPGEAVNAYKKAAISVGVKHSKGSLIVTTDADCMAPNAWLLHIAAIYQARQPVMVIAPVTYKTDHSLLHTFQLTDFMSMQGITAAAHNLHLGNMCNGANLAFQRSAFEAVNGYEGVNHLASGDDYLLMMKLRKLSLQGIAYLKSAPAIVSTTPQPSLGAFLQQRIRWSSKSGKYNDFRLTAILLLVYVFNLSFLVLLIAAFVNPLFGYILAVMFIVKVSAEYFFLTPVSRFFREQWVLTYFPLLQPFHILYIILAGFMGLLGGYKWKGRNVR